MLPTFTFNKSGQAAVPKKNGLIKLVHGSELYIYIYAVLCCVLEVKRESGRNTTVQPSGCSSAGRRACGI